MEMSNTDDLDETDKINVVPLADLSLVLLIIMMLLSPLAMSSMIKVETPKVDKVKAAKAAHKVPDPLLIRISKTGLTLNNNPVESVAFLGEQVGIKLHDDPERPVIVAADETVQVGDVVHVLDVIKQSGADKISLLKGSKGT